MNHPVDRVAIARRSLRRVIISAGLVVAGAALVILLLILVPDGDAGPVPPTQTSAPIIFPTVPTNR